VTSTSRKPRLAAVSCPERQQLVHGTVARLREIVGGHLTGRDRLAQRAGIEHQLGAASRRVSGEFATDRPGDIDQIHIGGIEVELGDGATIHANMPDVRVRLGKEILCRLDIRRGWLCKGIRVSDPEHGDRQPAGIGDGAACMDIASVGRHARRCSKNESSLAGAEARRLHASW
jgi:hypothetical protein